MATLHEMLVSLEQGNQLVTKTTINQQGQEIPSEKLTFVNGKWIMLGINCWRAVTLGLGQCSCESHPVWYTRQITRTEALMKIQDYLNQTKDDQANRQAEIDFLKSIISDLETLSQGQ